MKKIYNLIITFFYLGYLPKAPGTFGSLGALLVWVMIPDSLEARSLIFVLTSILGFIACSYALKDFDEKDPSFIVIDEVIGLWLALLFVPKNSFLIILGFVLFRFFDIFKPSIIYAVQFKKGVYGIMLDDIVAGLMVMLILYGFMI